MSDAIQHLDDENFDEVVSNGVVLVDLSGERRELCIGRRGSLRCDNPPAASPLPATSAHTATAP